MTIVYCHFHQPGQRAIDGHLGVSSALKTSAVPCCTSSLGFNSSSIELRKYLNYWFLLKVAEANWAIWVMTSALPVGIKLGASLHNFSVLSSWQLQFLLIFFCQKNSRLYLYIWQWPTSFGEISLGAGEEPDPLWRLVLWLEGWVIYGSRERKMGGWWQPPWFLKNVFT